MQVIFTNRQFKDKSGMPKDLLQSCLRPVLKNLTHIQKLSLPLLQGLSRLLYLLSNWFNVTLGDKLFGYLRQWTEPQKLQSLPDPKVRGYVSFATFGMFWFFPVRVAADFVEYALRAVSSSRLNVTPGGALA